MNITYELVTKVDGSLSEIEKAKIKPPVTLEEVLTVLHNLTFLAETVAHTRHLEREILPTTDKANKILEALGMKLYLKPRDVLNAL
jgi:hypothetical protein